MTFHASDQKRIASLAAIAGIMFAAIQAFAQTNAPDRFSFVAAGDMRKFIDGAPAGTRYFDGLCEALAHTDPGAFMISPGDCDPPAPIRAALDRFLGTNYLWYPVVGNHDVESSTNLDWLKTWAANIPHLVRRGPDGS